jgi:transcriptional regulator with XRE-family HTH domain
MASFGEELRRERELRDISLREISDATNISVQLLEALERNDFSTLPGGVYTRGFIRAFAIHIGVDPEETLTAFQQEQERQELGRQDSAGRGLATGVSATSSRAAEASVLAAFVTASALIAMLYWAGAATRPAPTAPDPAAHGAALKARVKKSGALPSHPSAEPPLQIAAAEPAPSTEPGLPAEPPSPEHLVGIRALETTRVVLTCAGIVQYREEMWVGVERQFPCREPILISASNGGAVEYSVDATPLRLLGREGERVRERLIGVDSRDGTDAEGTVDLPLGQERRERASRYADTGNAEPTGR